MFYSIRAARVCVSVNTKIKRSFQRDPIWSLIKIQYHCNNVVRRLFAMPEHTHGMHGNSEAEL